MQSVIEGVCAGLTALGARLGPAAGGCGRRDNGLCRGLGAQTIGKNKNWEGTNQ